MPCDSTIKKGFWYLGYIRRSFGWAVRNWSLYDKPRPDRQRGWLCDSSCWNCFRAAQVFGGCEHSAAYDVYSSNDNFGLKEGKQAYKASVFAGSICGVYGMYDVHSFIKKRKNSHEAAYFTVEASLILPIVMLFTTMMIFLAFYSYDRCILGHSAYEAALRGAGCHIKTASEAQALAENAAGSLVEEKLFAIKDFHYSVSADGDSVTVTYYCAVNMPFITWLGEYVSEIDMTFEISRSAKRYRPARTIRDWRILKSL